MRVIHVAVAGLVGAVLLAVIGCGTARRSTPFLGHEPRANRLAEGRQTFMRYCHSCHPGGEAGLGPALNNKPLPGSLIAFQVRHGLGAMPAFDDSVINEEQLDAVVEYLVALRRSR